MNRVRLNVVLSVVVLVVAVLLAIILASMRPSPEPIEHQAPAPLVVVMEAERRDVRFVVQGQGQVLPRAEIDLIAEVSGRAVEVSPALAAGGSFAEGDLLLRIDPRDYELAVDARRADVARAETLLARESAEVAIALAEWKEVGSGPPPPLVAREPQLAEARAALAGAKASLALARLDLERTEIRAPFDGRTRSEQVDQGQFLARGTPLARIYAIDAVEIRLPIADAELEFLDFDLTPMAAAAADATEPDGSSPVRISGSFAGEMHGWEGRVVRVEGELDPRTRMVGVVARVEDPYRPDPSGRPPLAVGMFVHAAIFGRTGRDLAVLPVAALRDGDRVAVIDEEDRLRLREVEVVRRESGRILVASGIEAGERVCLSPLDILVDGMPVRVMDPDDAAPTTASTEAAESRP